MKIRAFLMLPLDFKANAKTQHSEGLIYLDAISLMPLPIQMYVLYLSVYLCSYLRLLGRLLSKQAVQLSSNNLSVHLYCNSYISVSDLSHYSQSPLKVLSACPFRHILFDIVLCKKLREGYLSAFLYM